MWTATLPLALAGLAPSSNTTTVRALKQAPIYSGPKQAANMKFLAILTIGLPVLVAALPLGKTVDASRLCAIF